MAVLERPDGAELHWEADGNGPTIVICNTFNPGNLDGLVAALRESRRVVTYNPRGVAGSSGGGPYDLETGTDDLEALLEHAGPAAAGLGIGDGAHRALHVAERRPDLIEHLVVTSTTLGEGELPGFSSSAGVLGALMSLVRRDYRAALRSMVAASTPGAGDDDVTRRRVDELAETVPQEAAVGYIEAWRRSDVTAIARALGSRLTVLAYPGNDWFPLSMYEALRDSLTDACFELADDGPLGRPDQTAAVLERVSEPATA